MLILILAVALAFAAGFACGFRGALAAINWMVRSGEIGIIDFRKDI